MNEPLILSRMYANTRSRPVFLQAWWLKIVSECCDSVSISGRDGLELGSFLYWSRRNRLGLSFGYNPPLSHLAGFQFNPRLRAREQHQVIGELIAKLPKATSFHFVFDSKGRNADFIRLAFQDAGFSHHTHRSYLRPPGAADVLDGIKNPEHKRRLKSAERRLRTEEIGVAEFLTLYKSNLEAVGKGLHWPIEVAYKLISEGIRREQIYLLALKRQSKQGAELVPQYDSAIACICDPIGERLYYWMSTRSPASLDDKPHRDAPKILAKKAMEYAQTRNWTFDADGASTQGAEQFQRNSLGLSIYEERDVFMRLTPIARVYEDLRPNLRRVIGSLSGGRRRHSININKDQSGLRCRVDA